jgi:hypothetical protein
MSKKENKLGVVLHACNSSTGEAETGGLQVQDRTGLHSENLSQNPKIKNKK